MNTHSVASVNLEVGLPFPDDSLDHLLFPTCCECFKVWTGQKRLCKQTLVREERQMKNWVAVSSPESPEDGILWVQIHECC